MVRTPSLEGPDEVGGTVLVIDRDPEVADLIETYLRRRGYDVVQAHTADEALAMALKVQPRAITLDVILHEGDGFDLLHRLKERPETRDIPVVVLSIVCDEGKSCRMGAANYLEKPIDQGRLLKMIDEIVGSISSPVALVVDDDRDVVRVLSETLRKKGFAVVAAYDGSEAVAALEQRIPDIIVTDLRMPKMDGYDLIQRVKTTPEWAEVPVVVMTAHRIDRSRIDVLELAAHRLHKPFSPELIAQEVESVISGMGQEVADVKRILAVDDEPHILKLVSFSLKAGGFEVIEASDGLSAIEIAEAEQPDLILMDVMMPVLDGFESCRRLKDNPATKEIPVVMLTAKTQLSEQKAGLDCGAQDYICKPFTPKDLVAQVQAFLGD